MMINKRLISTVSESKKYVVGNVALQWCSLMANIAMMTAITALLARLAQGDSTQIPITTGVAAAASRLCSSCSCGSGRPGRGRCAYQTGM